MYNYKYIYIYKYIKKTHLGLETHLEPLPLLIPSIVIFSLPIRRGEGMWWWAW